jgi:hypothetical protein
MMPRAKLIRDRGVPSGADDAVREAHPQSRRSVRSMNSPPEIREVRLRGLHRRHPAQWVASSPDGSTPASGWYEGGRFLSLLSTWMIVMRRFALCLALLVLAGCGGETNEEPVDTPAVLGTTSGTAPADSAASAPNPQPEWTVRFDGAGPVRVGMTFDEARAALGGDLRMSDAVAGMEEGPDRCDHPRSGRLPAGVLVMVQGQRVVRVQVDSGAVSTAEGARIGDTEARIQQLYPGRVTVQPHKYTDGRYLVVRPAAAADTTHLLVFETDGRVVERFRAGQKPHVEYVEGCS